MVVNKLHKCSDKRQYIFCVDCENKVILYSVKVYEFFED